MKTVTLPEFLTESQISEATALYEAHGSNAVDEIMTKVIKPNMAAIDAKIGQKNDARYLAYVVVYVVSQLQFGN